ncbi:MAG: lipocalin-like domain-containing protein [Clostridiales Family XIII bacterium]|nr:lipocalin-like domain-containing protein [Clostridiales Family XIII bacterium]
MFAEWLKGTWKLDSFTGTDADGESIDMMGPGATGFISYSDDGWVSVQIAGADRPRYDIPDVAGGTDAQTLAAARSLFAYAGTFAVDEENGIVYHSLQFSLIPNWIGSRQKRRITKESENVLVLTADPARMGPLGKKRRSRLRWIRLER